MLMIMKLGYRGGVVPTLNVFDNSGDTRATVLIVSFDTFNQTTSQVHQTIKAGAANNENIGVVFMEQKPIIFYGNRVDDIRMQGDVINTLQARMGTGGGNMPIVAFDTYNQTTSNTTQAIRSTATDVDHIGAVAYSIREDAKANTFSATETDTALAVQALQPSPQSHHAQIFLAEETMVRRLTPMECERLQGFPDGWTEGQADTHRYKQMGNAVAVPVVSWLVQRLMEASK